ncbi:MAG: cell filamentation protein Fic [Oscillospiraceae bacterium]|nr:cell filamentation protein Fic [Oscillospiraceae bacterium]
MKNKFNMTREENITFAKRNIVDYIWKSAKLEGINVTFPETNAIFEGISVDKVPVDDVIKINNLKRAWQFLLETLDKLTDFDYYSRLNMYIGGDGSIHGAGKIRAYDVNITGTKWQPSIPYELDCRREISDILQIECETERAIKLMLWGMRRQVFIDGNKRNAMLFANKEMIANGCGVIAIALENIKEFYELLTEFYEKNDDTKIKQFIYENCIDGIDMKGND